LRALNTWLANSVASMPPPWIAMVIATKLIPQEISSNEVT
jgi:hypothetical protein